jgi:hypothetical protein
MKKIILAATFSMIIGVALSQTDKGDWLVGGMIDLNTGKNSTHIGFTPNAGTFLFQNFAVGGNILLDYQKSGDNKTTQFGIGPFARYYFTQHKARPLVHVNVNYLSSKVRGPGFSSTNTGTNLFIGGGLAYFINPNVSLEGVLGYANTKYKDFEGSGGLKFSLGFQVYLSKRAVESRGAED